MISNCLWAMFLLGWTFHTTQFNATPKKGVEQNIDPRDGAKIQAAINSFQSSSLQ